MRICMGVMGGAIVTTLTLLAWIVRELSVAREDMGQIHARIDRVDEHLGRINRRGGKM